MTNRAASYLNLKNFRAAIADYQRAILLRSFKPSAKTFIRLAQCQLAIGHTKSSLIALREAFSLEPENTSAIEVKSKVITLEGHITDFFGARAGDRWRMAQVSYEKGRKILEDQGGAIPSEWLCWEVELEIAKGNWDDALKNAK